MADKRLVVATFDTQATAQDAADRLKTTGLLANDAVAILSLGEDGKLKTHKIGTTSGGKGAAVGLAFGLLGPVGIGVGAAGGALLGKLHRKNLGLDDEDRARLVTELQGGKAAVGALVDPVDLVAVESILVGHGGTTESHEFDDDAVRETVERAG